MIGIEYIAIIVIAIGILISLINVLFNIYSQDLFLLVMYCLIIGGISLIIGLLEISIQIILALLGILMVLIAIIIGVTTPFKKDKTNEQFLLLIAILSASIGGLIIAASIMLF